MKKESNLISKAVTWLVGSDKMEDMTFMCMIKADGLEDEDDNQVIKLSIDVPDEIADEASIEDILAWGEREVLSSLATAFANQEDKDEE